MGDLISRRGGLNRSTSCSRGTSPREVVIGFFVKGKIELVQ